MRIPDGHHEYYIMQRKGEDGKWSTSPGSWGDPPTNKDGTSPWAASGRCWQELGIHGVYSVEDAISGVKWVSQQWPGHHFRAVKVTLDINTSPPRVEMFKEGIPMMWDSDPYRIGQKIPVHKKDRGKSA